MSDTSELVPLQLRKNKEEKHEEPPKYGGGLHVFLFVIFFLSFIFISHVFMSRYKLLENQKKENAELGKEVKSLENENANLLKTIEILKTIEGQEQIARKRLGLIKKGELIVEWEAEND